MDSLYIVSGLGLLFIGIAIAELIAGFRDTYKRATTQTGPILLDGWNLPRA